MGTSPQYALSRVIRSACPPSQKSTLPPPGEDTAAQSSLYARSPEGMLRDTSTVLFGTDQGVADCCLTAAKIAWSCTWDTITTLSASTIESVTPGCAAKTSPIVSRILLNSASSGVIEGTGEYYLFMGSTKALPSLECRKNPCIRSSHPNFFLICGVFFAYCRLSS